jgi:hypothetical protein
MGLGISIGYHFFWAGYYPNEFSWVKYPPPRIGWKGRIIRSFLAYFFLGLCKGLLRVFLGGLFIIGV